MAMGKNHDRFNFAVGAICLGVLVGLNVRWQLLLAFSLGWFFSTWYFSPDADLGPKKRAGLLRLFLYPYTFFVRHRGFSHLIFWGTIGRLFYLAVMGSIVVEIVKRFGHLPFGAKGYTEYVVTFIKSYDYQLPEYQWVTWFFMAHVLADASHIILDRLSTFTKKWL